MEQVFIPASVVKYSKQRLKEINDVIRRIYRIRHSYCDSGQMKDELNLIQAERKQLIELIKYAEFKNEK